MKFSYNWLKELTQCKESPQDLAELLSLRAFEVETVEKIGNDWALDGKVPTNRISDAGNHTGLAQELCAILNAKYKKQNQKLPVKIKKTTARPRIEIKIAEPDLCPRYTAVSLEIKTLGESPVWMRERLATCGFRTINAIVDITNYVMLETGQPLHAFDLDQIRGNRMTIRESRRGEKITTLDGITHALPGGALVIEDAERLIDLAGIMGGKNSAVSEKTKRILLQAAAFDATRIYKTTRALHFTSDAARMYSAGTDPNKTEQALARARDLFQQMDIAGAVEAVIDVYPKKVTSRKIFFRPDYAERIIGEPLGQKLISGIFDRLSFKTKIERKGWIVEIPTQRQDIRIEEDLIEEVARLYGYERLEARLPESVLLPASRNDAAWWERRVGEFLAATGFTESHLHEFTGDRELDQFFVDRSHIVELESPMNPETKYLVPRLLIKYVSSATENLSQFNYGIQIFGIGKSFQKTTDKKQETGIKERKEVVVVLAKKKEEYDGERFYQLKGAIDQMLESMGISDYWYDDRRELGTRSSELGVFHPYRVAEIKIGDEKIGNIGEIHPAVLENIKSKARVVVAEIDFERLAQFATAESEFRPIGKYPAVARDIAVLVPHNAKTEDVQNIIENIGGALLADTDLFDYFQDETMREAEEKSLAFHLIFQSPERTLTDPEIDVILKKIISALEEKGWEVRR